LPVRATPDLAERGYFMGATARRKWHRGPASLALLTSLVVLSSLFVIVGAQVASAAQCGSVNNTPACSLAFQFENPAKSGVYTDTSPHQAAVGETITRVDLNPSANPVVVEVEDAEGHRDQSFGGQISLALVIINASGTPTLSGATAPAVKGAASFPNLKITNGNGDFQLAATASPSTGFTSGTPTNPLVSGTFRIWADRCAPGDTCKDSFQTLMEASLANGGTGTVVLSVGIDGVDERAGSGTELTSCSVPATPTTPAFTDPWFHAPAETTVDEVGATGSGTKVVVLRIKKAWRLMVPDNGASSYRGCVTAQLTPEQARTITTWNNSPITETAPGQWTFLVPDCTKTITTFCRAFAKSNGGDVLEGLAFPSGAVFGDPRGH
jgi:hypothetical protein